MPYTQLHFLNIGEKHRANIEALDVVEDSLEDALEWSAKVNNVLIYDHPWNQTLNVKNLTWRVYNWNEIYREIQRLNRSNQTPPNQTVSENQGHIGGIEVFKFS